MSGITLDDIQKALADRASRLEAQKTKDLERAKARKAPAPANETSKGSFDLGF